MARSSPTVIHLAVAALAVAGLAACARPSVAGDLKRLHLTIAVGSTAQPSADLRLQDLGLDFRNALNVSLESRWSINERWDVTLVAQDNEAEEKPEGFEDAEMTLSSWFDGLGLRWYPTRSSLRPFVQAEVHYVRETIGLRQFGDWQAHGRSGAGAGLAAGVELLATWRFSIPVKVQALFAKPAENVSGVGFNVGLTYNRFPIE